MNAPLAETIEALCAEALGLAETAQRFPKIVQSLLGCPHALVQISCVRGDELAASGAVELVLSAQASERALVLLAALRAGHRDLGIVEHFLKHLIPPVASDSFTGGASAGPVASAPAASGQSRKRGPA